MLQDMISLYKSLVNAFYAGQATDEECALLQDLSVILQSKGLEIV